jgi:uncharacterized repeat protein (TIGR02543 family)
LCDCLLSGNTSTYGGGSYNGTLRNSVLSGNTSSYGGGAAYGTLYNCTLSGNAATLSGGGSYNGTFNNCIAWGNRVGAAANDVGGSTCYNTCASGLAVSNGCINADPLFADAANNNYRLRAGSPCIDRGSNALATIQFDLDGKARVIDGDGDGTATVDMGAYESAPLPMTALFDAQGGAVNPVSITVTNGYAYGTLPTPLKTGYAFEGWYMNSAGTGAQVTSSTVVTTGVDHTLYAKWSATAFTLTVVSARGGVCPGTVITNWGTGLTQWVTNSPAVNGATQFLCTAGGVAGNGFQQVSPTNVTLVLTNHAVLTWQWQPQYRLTTCTNGSGFLTAADGWYASSSNVVLTAASAANWHFVGWSGDTNGCVAASNVITVAMSQARSVWATFGIDRYTVTFHPMGGAVNPANTTVTNGLAYGALPTPQQAGYTFAGWYTNAACLGVQVTHVTVVTAGADHTLFAKWTLAAAVNVTPSGGGTAVAEGGAGDTYTVALVTQPSADVTVSVTPDNQVSVAPANLTFTAENWSEAQTVTVIALDDTVQEGTHAGAVTHTAASADASYNGIAVPGVAVTVTDNDLAVWNGGSSSSSYWSDAGNWGGAPLVWGEALVFGGAARLANTNDLTADTLFASITFESGSGAFILGGSPITLGGDLVNLDSDLQTLALPMTLDATRAFNASNGPVTMNGMLSGPGGIVKTGAHALTLAQGNSFEGLTSVGSGALRVSHPNALGTTNVSTTVVSNGSVEISGSVTVPEPLTVGDSGAAGALRATGGTNVWSGRVTQTAPSRFRALAGSRLVMAGGVSGSSAVYLSPDAGAEVALTGGPVYVGSSGKVCAHGAGLVTLGATGNTFGTMEVAGPTVRADVPGVLPSSAILAIGSAVSPNGTFDLNGNSQAVSQLKRGTTGAGRRLVTSATPATLTVEGGSSTTYDGVLSGALSLCKGGSATLTLSGTNTYSGTTVISNGTLTISSGASLSGSGDITVAEGVLSVQTGQDGLADTAVLRISDGGAKVSVKADVVETVGALYLGGRRQRRGTWGASSLTAEHADSAHFTGTGVIRVLHGPESVISVR